MALALRERAGSPPPRVAAGECRTLGKLPQPRANHYGGRAIRKTLRSKKKSLNCLVQFKGADVASQG
jgi:hypothetical protein